MYKKILPTLLIAATMLAGCHHEEAPDQDPNELVFCTEDAKVCPDGSVVSRMPPDCEFAACPIPNSQIMPENTISLSKLDTKDCNDDVFQTTCPRVGMSVAKIGTTKGDIWIKLFPEQTPKTVENFIGLVERGYYDGIIFHRVIPDFMIQSGDPTGTGTGGESIWGKDFEDEFVANLTNIRGALSMANRGPATNGSQFFIVQKDGGTPWLDGKHTVFGQVISGMDVVDELANVVTDEMDKPIKEVKMEKVEVYEVQ